MKSYKRIKCIYNGHRGVENIDDIYIHDRCIKKRGRRLDKEIKTLQLLKENFINEPEIDHYPFPEFINTVPCRKCGYKECLSVIMTHCGVDIIQNNFYNERKIQPVNLTNTVECIINNLRNTGIEHTDICSRNVCINEKGQISLIDFNGTRMRTSTKRISYYYKKPDLSCVSVLGEIADSNTITNYSKNGFGVPTGTLKWPQFFNYLYSDTDTDENIQNNIMKYNNKYFKKHPWSMLYMFEKSSKN